MFKVKPHTRGYRGSGATRREDYQYSRVYYDDFWNIEVWEHKDLHPYMETFTTHDDLPEYNLLANFLRIVDYLQWNYGYCRKTQRCVVMCSRIMLLQDKTPCEGTDYVVYNCDGSPLVDSEVAEAQTENLLTTWTLPPPHLRYEANKNVKIERG